MQNRSAKIKVIHSSFIYDNSLPQLRSIQSAFPFLCALSDGTILAAHQMGEAFESVDGTSVYSKSTDGGKTWSKPVKMFDKSKQAIPTSDCLKVSKVGENTLVGIGYEIDRRNTEIPIANPETGGWPDDEVYFTVSEDNGETWSARKTIPCAWGPHVEASAPITLLKDGSWATPITGFPAWDGTMTKPRDGRLLRSFDKGKTWNDDVLCMAFENKNLTCYEQRMCQLEDGTIVVIGWNEDTVTGELLNNHYTVSTDNGKTFSAPRDTGIHGQTASVCALGGNKLLALHSLRRDTDTPGILACIVEVVNGEWKILEKEMVWTPDTPIIRKAGMATVFAFLKFGQPGAILLSDGDILMSHWMCEEGRYKTVCTRIRL